MKRQASSAAQGFSLVEVAIAFGIVSFGLVILLALLPVGLSSSREATTEEAATELLTAACADLRASPPHATDTAFFQVPTNPTTEANEYFTAAGVKVATPSEAKFRLTIARRASASPGLEVLYVSVSWPPQSTASLGRVETLVMRARPPRL